MSVCVEGMGCGNGLRDGGRLLDVLTVLCDVVARMYHA